MTKTCCISWCVALTDKIFCADHEKNQALHPKKLDRLVDEYEHGYQAGYAAGIEDAPRRHDDDD